MVELLIANQIAKSYLGASCVFEGVDLTVNQGEIVSIVGESGSGKSTILHVLSSLDRVTHGSVTLNGSVFSDLDDVQLTIIRQKYMGFIYQFHHLLQEFTALENVMMPIFIQGLNKESYIDRAHLLLKKLFMDHRAHYYPSQLSGGERQRVAIARAIINNPLIIFADEPTGNLDNTNSMRVFDMFLELQAESNCSVVIVTHNLEIASKTQSVYRLHNGALHVQ